MRDQLADPVTYSSYLRLDTLLAAQHPMSEEHDEVLFIIIHQTAELWLNLMLNELRAARHAIAGDRVPVALKMLARVFRIQMQLVHSWDVLATMTPTDYLSFRDYLGTGSGFQSVQYRMVEFVMGEKKPEMVTYHATGSSADALKAELEAPSIYDEVLRLLARRRFDVPGECIDRDFTRPYVASPRIEAIWKEIYTHPNEHWDVYELAEKLVDLEYKFQQWRFGHLKTVERIIGFREGTARTSGVGYLEKVVSQRFFHELLSVRTII